MLLQEASPSSLVSCSLDSYNELAYGEPCTEALRLWVVFSVWDLILYLFPESAIWHWTTSPLMSMSEAALLFLFRVFYKYGITSFRLKKEIWVFRKMSYSWERNKLIYTSLRTSLYKFSSGIRTAAEEVICSTQLGRNLQPVNTSEVSKAVVLVIYSFVFWRVALRTEYLRGHNLFPSRKMALLGESRCFHNKTVSQSGRM